MRKIKYEYICVKELPAKARAGHPGQKMTVRAFDIRLTDGKTTIGEVRWHKLEHRYMFRAHRHPMTPPKSSPILKDIARFIDMLMKEHANDDKQTVRGTESTSRDMP